MSMATPHSCLEALVQEEIVDCLEPTNLDALSTKAAEMGVVSSEVKRRFDSLDPGVPRPRKIRYLLIHAYEQLESDPRKLGRWLKVLAGHGVPSAVLERVEKARGAGATGTNVGGGHEERCPQNIATFSEEHVGALTEILASCSGKWREIRMSLNLPHSVEKSIEARLHMYSDKKCLSEVLHEWIVGSHEHAKTPTPENLKKALGSQTVGLGKTASQLDEALIKHFASLAPGTSRKRRDDSPFCMAPSSKKIRLDTSTAIEVVSQTIDTEVEEEKSTLLEVEAVSTCGDTISYQWIKDGCPLEDDGEHYLGSKKSILCITASLATKGTYTCEVRGTSSESEQLDALTVSKPAIVRVHIPHSRKVLMDMYCAQSDVHRDAWPPVGNRTYINLALVKQEKLDKKDTFYYSTIQGDVDDVVYRKESIGYDKAFKNHRSGTLLLIEGRPGSGKTTLVHKVSEDWATGKPILKGARLVFLISLRILSTKKIVKLADIIKEMFYRNDDETAQSVLKKINSSNGEDVCFILDGLDEYETQESVIFELIQRDYLQQAMVILSSRPSATIAFRKKADVYIEVIGFLKNQIEEYIQNYPFSSVDSAGNLLLYLEHHPNVLRMCYLPVHIAMVSFLHDTSEGGLPSTECGIYTHFTKLTLLRKGPGPYSDAILKKICEFAFDTTVSQQQVYIDEGDFKVNDPSLGLITINRTAKMYGYHNLYTFVHLTFQEYLAAYFISQLGEQKQREVISKYSHMERMRVVWRFYCGLVSFKNEDPKFEKILESCDDQMFHCQCAFESQQQTVCKSVVLHNHRSLKFEASHPADFACLAYVLSGSCCPLESLQIVSDMSTGSTLCACTNVLEQCGQLKSFDISDMHLGDEGAKVLGDGFRHCSNLSVLQLNSNLIGDMGAKGLDVLRQCSSLSKLYLNFNEIGDEGAKCLGDCLKHCSNLSVLHLNDNKIGEEGAKGLGDGLRQCSNLSELQLDNNRIGNKGAKDLSNSLRQCISLSELYLYDNKISNEGAKSLGDVIKMCSNLSVLDLGSNRIGNDGAKGFGDGLRHCSNLSVLHLGSNRIGDDGARSLCDGLRCCSNLSKLHLDNNRISDHSVKELGDVLRQCSDLSEFHLGGNKIGDDGAKELGDSLRQCNNLSVLNLCHNKIGDKGAACLGDVLRLFCNLSELYLNYNKIGGKGAMCLGNGIRECDNLSILNLNGNQIGDQGAKGLCDGLTHCSNLSRLHLVGNSIGDQGAHYLGDNLRHCSNLSELHLDENEIGDEGAKGLCDGLRDCSDLFVLHLDQNEIGDKGAKGLCDVLRHCSDLLELHLDGNKIGDEGAKGLGDGLRMCSNLIILYLDCNKIGDEGAKGLCDGLRHCSNLSGLHLDGNLIGDQGAHYLGDNLWHCSDLSELHLDENEIGVEGAKGLGDGLRMCSNLTELYLNNNKIGDKGAKGLCDGLRHCSNLSGLHLDGNLIGDQGAHYLGDNLRHCSDLSELHLDKNEIGDEGAKGLGDGLRMCSNLTELYLNNNKIDDKSAKGLCDGLRLCSKLLRLHLDGNLIGDQGVHYLGDGLRPWCNLSRLHLHGNLIGDPGAHCLGDNLGHCSNLFELHLGENEIGDEGAKGLGDGLRKCTNLFELHLNNNKIGDEGAKGLCDGLRHCSNLTRLHLDGNLIGDQGAHYLGDNLRHCSNLSELYLDENEIGDEGAKGLGDGLRHCSNLSELHLDGNLIGDQGAHYLGDNLRHCSNLSELHLDENEIGDEGAKGLGDGLRHCSNLSELHLDGNLIGDQGAHYLGDGLRTCSNLTELHLRSL